MNSRVPQYPYTFYCAELLICGLEHCVSCIHSHGKLWRSLHFAEISKKFAKPQISKGLAEHRSVQDTKTAHGMI